MSIPPAILDLRVHTADRRVMNVWLPIFLLWPLELALGVLAFVLTLVVDALLVAAGQSYHHYTLLLYRVFEATTELRGLVVRVHNAADNVDLVFM